MKMCRLWVLGALFPISIFAATGEVITTDTHRFTEIRNEVYLAQTTERVFNSNALVIVNADDVVLDAVDVAFTEAAVGVGISTVLMLATIGLAGRHEKRPAHRPLLPLLVVVVTGAALVYGTLDMPHFGDPNAPVHQHVVPRYLQRSADEIGIPNVVTNILASYRGYDTLGELTVIFTAGVGVLALLGLRRRRRERPGPGQSPP